MLLDWLPDARLHVIDGRRALAAVGEARRVPARPPRLPAAREGPAMSEIVGFVGMSHSPFATLLPPPAPAAPGGRFLADAARVAAAVAALAPDAVVVIGPDHFHANFYDVMPPFVLGVEEAEAFGDFGSRSGPLPVGVRAGLVRPRRAGRRRVRRRAVLRAHRRPRHRAELRDGHAAAPTSRWSRWWSTPPRRRCRPCGAASRSAGRSARRSGAGGAGPGADRRQRRPVALAAVQRPARPVGARRTARARDPRPRATPAPSPRPASPGSAPWAATRTPGSTPTGTPGS